MYPKLGLQRREEDMIMGENLNKSLYKTALLYLKIIPILIAGLDFSHTVLSYYNVDIPAISYIAGISLLPIIFIFLTSYVFGFCSYHRIPIYYVITNNIICIYDEYIGIPISDRELLSVYISLLFLSIIVIIVDYVKSNKKYSSKFNK